jgi:Glyoxalase-like domain
MHIDHAIIATADLDATARRLEDEYGLAVSGGGRHLGIGTANRIVPLGPGYLELIAVVDAGEAEATPLGRALAERITARGEGLMGWVVAVEDARAEAARTGVELSVIERSGLRATLAGVATAMAEPTLPFFIQRDPGIDDPGAGGTAGGLKWVEVAGDERRLAAWLGHAELPVRIVPGSPGVRAVGIGPRELRL